MIPDAEALRNRLAAHLRSCLYCQSTPEDQPPACGVRIQIERDLGWEPERGKFKRQYAPPR